MKKFRITMMDGFYKVAICKNGKPDKYGTPKDFKTRKEAEEWIKKHTYKGMSFKYEIIETID